MSRFGIFALVLGISAIGCSKDASQQPNKVSGNSATASSAAEPAADGPKLAAADNAAAAPAAGNKNADASLAPSNEQKPTEPLPTEKIAAAAVPAPTEEVLLGTEDLTIGIPGAGKLTIEEITKWLDNKKNEIVLMPKLPLGLAAGSGQMAGLGSNPLTRAKIELGRQLYFDPRLSKDASISCASCHQPDFGYAKNTQFGEGMGGQKGKRNSPVAYNRILSSVQFWDGRAATLEEQAKGPIANPIEMANTHDVCVDYLAKIPGF
jgi:hypothetical protein